MKKTMMFVLLALSVVACNRRRDLTEGKATYVPPAGLYSGSFNGKPATLRLDKSGDRVSGTLEINGVVQQVSGFDKGTVSVSGMSGSDLALTLSKTAGGLEIISGGTGFLAGPQQ